MDMTPRERDQIITLYRDEGYSIAKLALFKHCKVGVIRDIVAASGVRMRNTPFTDADESDIIRRYHNGQSSKIIALAFGTSPNRILKLLRDRGITINASGVPPHLREVPRRRSVRAA
jgi:hypothetical protein